MQYSRKLTLFATVAMLPSMSPAWAEDANPVTLDPIVVEARKWKEDASKVPLTVVKLTKEDTDSPTFLDLRSLQKHVPNVQAGLSTADSRFIIRGMTSADFSMQNPVGHFVNDIALPYGALQAPTIFDVDSLEVIKGPQGTLYGRNTEAGAIKLETANPDWTPAASASIGTYFLNGRDSWEPGYIVKGRISGPVIKDVAALSLALRAETTEGIHFNKWDQDDTGGDLDQIGLSAGAEVVLGDDTTLTVKNVTDRQKRGARRFRFVDGNFKTERFVTDQNTKSGDRSLKSVQSVRVDHSFEHMDFVSISGWSHYDYDMIMDLDTTSLAAMSSKITQENNAISQEFRLSSANPDQNLKWLAGVYVFHEWADIYANSMGVRATDIEQDGIAGFGQVDYTYADRWHFGLGARVEHVDQAGSQHYTSMMGARSYFTKDMSKTVVLPKASIAYDVTPKTMMFASYARGYLPGGYNYSRSGDQDTFYFEPEYSWTAEVGLKTKALNDRLSAGVTLFHTTTKDKQVVEFNVSSSAWKISNAGEAENYGIEFNTDYVLDANWSAFANLGLLHAEATSYTSGAADYSGNRLPMAANLTYGFGISYEQDKAAQRGWFAEASLNGSGSSYFDIQNALQQDAYVIVDSRIGYRLDGAEISLWGTNLLDAETYDIAGASMNGTIVQDSRPRTIGLNLSMKF